MSELTTLRPSAAPAVRPTARRGGLAVAAWPAAGLLVAVGGWWLVTELFDIKEVVLPPPQAVLAAYLATQAFLLEQTWSTTLATAVGFALSVAVGVLIGVMLAAWRPVERMFAPLLVAFNAVPKVSLAPLMLIWFGYGQTPILAMALMVCFFPIVLATTTGLITTPADLAELTRSLDASRAQAFLKVRVPAALPQIFVGLKVAMPLAVIGVVVGEMQYGESGLGMVIVQTSGQGDTATAFAAIGLLSFVSIVLYYALVAVERLALPWVRATTSRH